MNIPTLDGIGRDLLAVSPFRRARSLSMPFVLCAAFFLFAARGWWPLCVACTMLMTFLTYGSISHDLVHRNLRLPKGLNESLLSAIELISFRCGHAYRVVHLHHHARFPAADDLEGAAAGMPWWRSLLIEGPTLQPRLLLFALRHGRDRGWIIGEAVVVLALFAASLAAIPWTIAPAVYAFLMIAGSWLFPFITSTIPHDPRGADELTQTRLFRGRLLDLIALRHLYHLEHHLFPQVPHHNWPELARRLDPFFDSAGLRARRLLF